MTPCVMPAGVDAWVAYPARGRTAPRRVAGSGDGDTVGFDHLEEIHYLVEHLWDAAVLHRLGVENQPMRFGNICTAVDQWSGRRTNDSDITRALDRLRKAGYVTRSDRGSRRSRIHTLTPRGREKAGKVGIVIGALEAHDADEELVHARHDDGAPPDAHPPDTSTA